VYASFLDDGDMHMNVLPYLLSLAGSQIRQPLNHVNDLSFLFLSAFLYEMAWLLSCKFVTRGVAKGEYW